MPATQVPRQLLLAITMALATAGAALLLGAVPPAHADPTSDWAKIDMGGDHSCGVKTSGRLYCWGSDDTSQLGDGADDGAAEGLPVEVAGSATDWADVDAGENHTCALKTTNELFCWGLDFDGQLGDGDDDEAHEPAPVEVAGSSTDWQELGVGDDTTCARKASRRLFCWGYGEDGQIGNDDTVSVPAPERVIGGASWKQVSGGGDHICAIKTTRRLYCWGSGGSGALGIGSFGDKDEPQQVAGGDWKQVGGGDSHSCAIKTTRKLFCWGSDDDGQLGDGNDDQDFETSPVRIAGGDWKQVTEGGDDHTCALDASGRLHCWGYDLRGQLGDGLANSHAFTPGEVAGATTDWKQVETGDDHTCARKTTMQLFCWGREASGQVGNGSESLADELVPVEVGS